LVRSSTLILASGGTCLRFAAKKVLFLGPQFPSNAYGTCP